MRGWLIAIALASTTAHADDEIGDQGIGADLGVATGGHITPGGLRIVGHYLYQLSDQDWFDGTAGFTFGGGQASCFRDRTDTFICQHGLADGDEIEVAANIRRVFAPQGKFRPFAGIGIGLGYVRFGNDGVSGLAIPFHGFGGVRARVNDGIAVVAQAELSLGSGELNHSLGSQPQLGVAIVAGAEFRLR
jgi:hypothetical protein